MILCDLHIHTTYSDGLCTPIEIFNKIKDLNIGVISFTEHDCIEGIDDILNYIRENKLNIKYLVGCEFSTFLDEIGEIHILSYFTNKSYSGILNILEDYRKERIERALKIIELLNKEGIKLSLNFIHDMKQPVGRMHIAREIIKQGYNTNIKYIFDRYLKNGSSCYVPRKKINPIEIIKLIKENNGISILAHPVFLYKKENWYILDKFIIEGLNGIEVYHPKIDSLLSIKLKEFIKEYNKKNSMNLIYSGGSDYHGDDVYNGLGKFGIDIKEFNEFFKNIDY